MDAIPRPAPSTTPAATDSYTPTRSSSSAAPPQFGLNRGHLLRLHESRPSPLLYSRSHTTSPLNSPYVLSPRIPSSLRAGRFKTLFYASESPSRDERASEGRFKSWVDGLKTKAKRALHENEKSETEFNGWIESEERRQRALFEFPASLFAGDEDDDTVQSVAFDRLGEILLEEKHKREIEIAEEHAAKKRRRTEDREDAASNTKPVVAMSAAANVSVERLRRSPIRIYEDPQSRSGSEHNGYGGSIKSEDDDGEVYTDENVAPHRKPSVPDAPDDETTAQNNDDSEAAAENGLVTDQDRQAEELSDAENPMEYDYEDDEQAPADSNSPVEQRQDVQGLDLFTTSLPIDPALFSTTADDFLQTTTKTNLQDGQGGKDIPQVDDAAHHSSGQGLSDADSGEFGDDGDDEESHGLHIVDEKMVELVEGGDYHGEEEYDEYNDYDEYDEEYEQDQGNSGLALSAAKFKPASTLFQQKHAYSSPPASDLEEDEYESEDESEASAEDQSPPKSVVQSSVIDLSSDESGEDQDNGPSPPSSSSSSSPLSEAGSDEDSDDYEPDEDDDAPKGSMWTPTIPGTKPSRVLNHLRQHGRPSLIDTVRKEYDQEEDQSYEDEDYDEHEIEIEIEIENGNKSSGSGEQNDDGSGSESEQSFQQTFQDDDDPQEERRIEREERRKERATEEADQQAADVEDNSESNADYHTQTTTIRPVDERSEASEVVGEDDEVFIEEEAQTPLVHESDSDPNELFPEEDEYWEGKDEAQPPATTVSKSPEFKRVDKEYRVETRNHSTFSLEGDEDEIVTEADLDNIFLQANAQESK
ncbi:hypothetical protein V1517DRAFT_318859 [Lipomyces orientalis]|uniref:Uncharacterized protein n=1 Tax=Lipomyces orientalis TaxID=1233043 RepID=A0ACC3TSQ6_9ASCO